MLCFYLKYFKVPIFIPVSIVNAHSICWYFKVNWHNIISVVFLFVFGQHQLLEFNWGKWGTICLCLNALPTYKLTKKILFVFSLLQDAFNGIPLQLPSLKQIQLGFNLFLLVTLCCLCSFILHWYLLILLLC